MSECVFRRLVYDFLDLPSHVQLKIGRELDLMQVGENFGKDNTYLFAAWFRRVMLRNKLEELREAVRREREALPR